MEALIGSIKKVFRAAIFSKSLWMSVSENSNNLLSRATVDGSQWMNKKLN